MLQRLPKQHLAAGSVVLLGLLIALGVIFRDHLPQWGALPDGEAIPIDWGMLRGLDWRSGEASARVSELNNQIVRIPGFVVPLEDEVRRVREFLFVPTMQACIHVPPPPPNQMILVKMNRSYPFDWNQRAYWLEGVLSVEQIRSPYGQVSYQMQGLRLEQYRHERAF